MELTWGSAGDNLGLTSKKKREIEIKNQSISLQRDLLRLPLLISDCMSKVSRMSRPDSDMRSTIPIIPNRKLP